VEWLFAEEHDLQAIQQDVTQRIQHSSLVGMYSKPKATKVANASNLEAETEPLVEPDT
jgi:hypothetical protein